MSFASTHWLSIANVLHPSFKSNRPVHKPSEWFTVYKEGTSATLRQFPRCYKLVRWERQRIKRSRIGVWLYTHR